MTNSRVSLESLLYANYIKYDRLAYLTDEAFRGSGANSVNIYIDLYSFVTPLYYRYRDFTINNYNVLTASMINLCAHLRGYFATRHSVATKIFLVYSNNVTEINRQLYPWYNKRIYESLTNNKVIYDMSSTNMRLLDLLTRYLHDIYYIETGWEASVAMYDVILREQDKGNYNPNIIYSKDQYCYQLPAMTMNTVLYRPKKSEGRDVSWCVTKNNAITSFVTEDRKTDPAKTIGLSPELLSALMALSNLPGRGIKSFLGISRALSALREGISEHLILNGHNISLESFYEVLSTRIGLSRACRPDTDEFNNRYKAIDIINQYIMYLNSPSKVLEYEINLYDPEAVKQINNEYFKYVPLDLNRL